MFLYTEVNLPPPPFPPPPPPPTHTQGTLCDDFGNRLDAVYVRPENVSDPLPLKKFLLTYIYASLCCTLSMLSGRKN